METSMTTNKELINQTFKGKYFYGLGRRKTSIAKVRLYSGKGQLIINGKEIKNKADYLKPLTLTNNIDKFDVSVVVHGGGTTGQLDSVNLGSARALVEFDKDYRQLLKKHGLLKRDPRKVERKKAGLRKARRSPQWSKR